jgi:hypothetical protein
MGKLSLKFILIGLNFIILFFCLIILIFNLNFIAVIHYSSGMLPIITYTTYSSLQLNIIYIFIVFLVLNIVSIIYDKLIELKGILVKINPLMGIILILIIFINPHLIIVNPIGSPTRLDYLQIGAFFLISLLITFIIINLISIIQEGYIKKYFIILGILIAALFMSELIHEGGHAIFALLSGGQVTEFKPYPSFLANELNAGYVAFVGVPATLLPLVIIGSEIFQWITVIILTLLLYYRKFNYFINIFLKFLLIVSWLDFPLYTINNILGLPHWFIIGSTHGDILEFSALTGISIWIMLAVAIFQLVSGLIIFYYLGIFKFSFFKSIKEETL